MKGRGFPGPCENNSDLRRARDRAVEQVTALGDLLSDLEKLENRIHSIRAHVGRILRHGDTDRSLLLCELGWFYAYAHSIPTGIEKWLDENHGFRPGQIIGWTVVRGENRPVFEKEKKEDHHE